MSTSTLVVAGLIVAAALLVTTTVIRHPVARRLAVRSAGRRHVETALVVLGSLLGTAIITGSLVVGDTLDSSIRAGAFTQLGPIDETVTAPGVGSLPLLRESLDGLSDDPDVDGLTFGLRARGTVASGLEGPDPSVEPEVLLLEVDINDAADFGQDPSATGLAGASTPQSGQVSVSTDLADELNLQVGDELSVFAYDTRRSFEVIDVLPQVGLAGYSTGLGADSLNVFLPLGTIEQMVSAGPAGQRATPPVAVAFVSNQGDVLGGVERTSQVSEAIRARLGSGGGQVEVIERKQQLLDTADEIASQLSEVFLGIGVFAVVAGVLLLVNVFVMLADERRNELGIMRAVGMHRGELVRAFSLEGGLYAVVAAVLGAFAGIGVGAGIVQFAKGIASGPAGFTLQLRFAANPASVVAGFLVGLLIALVTILVTSVRISRLNIIRAIRDLPSVREPSRGRIVVVVGAVVVVLGTLVTVAAVSAQDGTGLFLGPAILAIGAARVLGRYLDRSHVVTTLGLAVVIWGLAAPVVAPEAFLNADVIVFVAQGLVLTGAAVSVLAHNQDRVGRLVRRVVGGISNITARLGLAYPMARPFRTTMTLAMYALVVFTLVMISVLSQAFGGQVDAFTDAESGGFDILVESASASPLPADEVAHEDVETVASLNYASFNIEFRAPGQQEFRRWFASGYDRQLLQTRPPALDRWLADLPDNEIDVWRYVLDHPDTMIADPRFLQEGGTPQQVELGDVIDVRDPVTGTTQQRTIIAFTEGAAALSGPFLADDSLTAILGPRAPASRLYIALNDQADSRQVADTLEAEHLDHGVQARTFRSVVAERQSQMLQFLRILQGYLVLGLLVGIAGLAVVMVRAVRERRLQIGLLRAVGLQPGTVGRSFMLEAGFISLQGILVGALLGAATARQLIVDAAVLGGIEVGFVVPWAELGLLLAITLAASVLAAGWPARQASQIRPATALRTTE